MCYRELIYDNYNKDFTLTEPVKLSISLTNDLSTTLTNKLLMKERNYTPFLYNNTIYFINNSPLIIIKIRKKRK